MRNTGRPNIIFLMLDTVRADCLSLYKGEFKTRTLEKIGQNGITYKNAISPGTYTLTSHASIFTGRRVMSMKQFLTDPMAKRDLSKDYLLTKYLSPKTETVAKTLSNIGYNTSLFSNNALVSEITGLATGFKHIQNLDSEAGEKKAQNFYAKLLSGVISNSNTRERVSKALYVASKVLPVSVMDELAKFYMRKWADISSFNVRSNKLDTGAKITNKAIIDYISSRGQIHDNFIFVNYIEAHEGYPTHLVTDERVEQNRWMYLTGIAEPRKAKLLRKAYGRRITYLDGKINDLLERLKGAGILDNALLIIASDHGQAFLEHNLMYHGMFPFNEVSRVPLITGRFLNGDQIRERTIVNETVSLSRIYPYILQAATSKAENPDNIRADEYVVSDHTGTDVFNPADVHNIEVLMGRSKYLHDLYQKKKYYNTFASAVYFEDFKLIHFFNERIKDQLFNLADDPTESLDIAKKNAPLTKKLAKVAHESSMLKRH